MARAAWSSRRCCRTWARSPTKCAWCARCIPRTTITRRALRLFLTGKVFSGRPTLGAWTAYALGSENENLPAFVALRDPKGHNSGGTLNWDSGWLPAVCRATEVQSQGSPVLNLHSAVTLPAGAQRADLELLEQLNEEHRRRFPREADLEARIRHYELAARMQLSAEKVLDLANETEATQKAYGMDRPPTADYGKRCLMARRLVEAGVRFVHIDAPVRTPWDNHSNLKQGIEEIAGKVDQPAAALIRDLQQRGLLDSTIVVWTGEFGRLPVSTRGQRPRPQPQRLRHVRRRWRFQERVTSTARPTNSVTARSREKSVVPISWRRSSISWGSPTNG